MVYTDGTALVADTIEELDAFARKVGVFTFYDHRRRPHYVVEKTSLPTVMAHGAKRVGTSELIRRSNAMAKKRELWFVDATDEQLREKIEKYAPFQRDEKVFYEGDNFSQEEMFEIMLSMYKDMRQNPAQADAIAKQYKLPRVLPLTARQDPPTDRETLAELYNKIAYGKDLLAQEEAKEEKDRNLEYIADIKMRLEELEYEHDPLELKIQNDAIAALKGKIDVCQYEVDALGKIDTGNQEHREKITKLRSLQTQLEALNERLEEIKKAQAAKEQGRPVTQEMLDDLLKKMLEMEELLPALKAVSDTAEFEKRMEQVRRMKLSYDRMLIRLNQQVKTEYDQRMQDPLTPEDMEELSEKSPDYLKENPTLIDTPDAPKYPTAMHLNLGEETSDHTTSITPEENDMEGEEMFGKAETPVFSKEELNTMAEDIRKKVTKAAVDLGLEKFLEMYPQYTYEDYCQFVKDVVGTSGASHSFKKVYRNMPDGTRRYIWYPMDYEAQEGEECHVVELNDLQLLLLKEDMQRYGNIQSPLYRVVYDPALPLKPWENYEEIGYIPSAEFTAQRILDEEKRIGNVPDRLTDKEMLGDLELREKIKDRIHTLGSAIVPGEGIPPPANIDDFQPYEPPTEDQ